MSVLVQTADVAFLARYRDDPDAPTLLSATRDLVVRAVLPGIALILVGLGAGALATGPLAARVGEGAINQTLQQGRTPVLDELARITSATGGVSGNIVICVFAVGLFLLVTRQWWMGLIPFVTLNLHTFVHLTTSTIVGRSRPPVEQLDIGQPTASFPSGHMGATTAQLLVLLFFGLSYVAGRVQRAVVALLLAGYLVVLGWSRLYLGMHYASDVTWGVANGVACGVIGWLFLRRDAGDGPAPTQTLARRALLNE